MQVSIAAATAAEQNPKGGAGSKGGRGRGDHGNRGRKII